MTKILLVVPYYTEAFEDRNNVKGGIEAMVMSAIPVLHKHGHDVHVLCVGRVEEWWQQFATFYSVSDICNMDLPPDAHKPSWGAKIGRLYAKKLIEIAPDVVVSHMMSSTVALHASHMFPTLQFIHSIPAQPLYFDNVIKNNSKIIANGGRVMGSPSVIQAFHDFNEKRFEPGYRIPDDEIATDELKSYQILEPMFDGKEILPATGKPVMAGRYEPKYLVKRIHVIDKAGVPIVAFVVGENEQVIKQLSESETCDFHHNAHRDLIVENMRKAPATILGLPTESAGLVAFEGMVFGAVPICMVAKTGDRHAASKYVEYADPTMKTFNIAYEEKDWPEQVNAAIAEIRAMPFERRKEFAMASRQLFSEQTWHDEFLGQINRARCIKPFDIYDT